jgi:hypothetical protein
MGGGRGGSLGAGHEGDARGPPAQGVASARRRGRKGGAGEGRGAAEGAGGRSARGSAGRARREAGRAGGGWTRWSRWGRPWSAWQIGGTALGRRSADDRPGGSPAGGSIHAALLTIRERGSDGGTAPQPRSRAERWRLRGADEREQGLRRSRSWERSARSATARRALERRDTSAPEALSRRGLRTDTWRARRARRRAGRSLAAGRAERCQAERRAERQHTTGAAAAA